MPAPTTENVENPTVWGYHARLDTLLLRLVAREEEPYVINRSFQQTDTVNTSANPEDFIDEFGRTFSMVEFYGGEDRKFAHRRSNTSDVQNQFWRSYGLEINESGNLQIVNQMEQITASGGAQTHPTRATYDGTAIYRTNDTADLTKITNLLGSPPTTATEVTGLAATARDVASLGGVVYACDGNEIRDNAGGWAQWSDLNAVRIWAVKDRIVASDGAQIYEDPDGPGPHTALFPNAPSNPIIDVVDAGAYVLAASASSVYALTFDGTALALAAQREFPFETITAIGALQGAAFVLTYQQDDDGNYTQRLWLGEVADDGTLVAEVVREWETDTETEVAACIAEVERDSVYLAIDDGTDTSLWKYNVGFGYLMSDRIMDAFTGQQVTDILKVLGRFWVFGDDGDVWRETATRRASGTFVSPAIDHFTADSKIWSALKTNVVMPGGTDTVEVSVSTDLASLDEPITEGDWTRTQFLRSPSTLNARIMVGASRYLSVRAVLRGQAELASIAVRSLPPVSDDEIILQVNVSDHVSRPGKAPLTSRNLGEDIWARIRNLQGRAITLELYDLDRRWRGSIVDVATPVTGDLDRNSVTKVARVVFRGLTVESTSTLTSGGWGSHQWGARLWGSEEGGA